MEFSTRRVIAAPAERVRHALGDLTVLQACIPGCESLEPISDTAVRAVIAIDVGGFKSRFTGTVQLEEMPSATHWQIAGDGRGRPSGSVRAKAEINLVTEGARTAIGVFGSGDVGGKLADVPAEAIAAEAKSLADEFFLNLENSVNDKNKGWVDELDHSPAGVKLGDEPSEEVVEDKAETAAAVAERIEEDIEVAAASGVLGGPVVWGLLALALLIIILVLIY